MKRSVRFALLGAVGCLIAALLGEVFLAATRPPDAEAERPPRALSLLIDCSGSMKGKKLKEVKQAATRFAERQDLERDSIAVLGFDSRSWLATGLTHSPKTVESAISVLIAENGSTAMDTGLQAAQLALHDATGERNILLFTDGEPDQVRRTLRAAEACRAQGIRIVAVGTGHADTEFLARLTGDPPDPSLVFHAKAGNYGEGFRKAEQAIYGPTAIVESASKGDASLEQTLLRTGGWTALLALGISLALIVGQNKQRRRRGLSLRQAVVAVPGSLAAGAAAGAAGQMIFLGAARFPSLELVARTAGWVLLGALLGRGMALVVPNLKSRRALLGGALGGAVGAAGFLWAAGALSDIAGRLTGGLCLGFFIGLMIALVEVMFRRAWLEIGYGSRETDTVTLGAKPVTVGSSDKCTVWAAGAPEVAFRFRLENNKIYCDDLATQQSDRVKPGYQKAAGKVTVTVCTGGTADIV
ncbi:MAG: VWA domain-containing protein [Planctomycetota bacterium]|jgi:Ca-activated chloride channel family protein